MKCLIIDDEPAARDILKTYITDCPDTEVAGICEDALEARSWLENNSADLLFVDINMPKLSGLGLIKTLHYPPQIILTTAYSEHAVDGFELGVTDYLLKPFSFERFLKAIDKVRQQLKTNAEHGSITIKADGKLFRIDFEDVLFVESQGDYLTVHTTEKRVTFYETLKEFCKKLPASDFIRIHRSYAVSLSKIDYLEGNLVKIGEHELPVGKSFKEEFLQKYTA